MAVSRAIGKDMPNPVTLNDKVLVSKVSGTGTIKADILKAVNPIGGFEKVIAKGETVLLKPNYNSSDSPPA